MPRGGRRKGAGRPKGTGKFGEPTKAVRLPISMIDQIMSFIERKGLSYPLYSSRVQPNPKSETVPPEKVDLATHLVPSPATTFFARAADDSMNGAGIFSGDLLIVDKELEPNNGDIVVAAVKGKFTVRRMVIKNKKIELKPENSKATTIKIANEDDLEVWGVVKSVVHSF